MSRREERDSHARRLYSRSEREPSPKKSKRDGKQTTERRYSSSRHLDTGTTDQEQNQRRRLQDALPPETPATTEPDVHLESTKADSTRKVNGVPDANRPSLDPKEVPRSRSYFKHDERGSAGHGGRTSGRSATDNERRNGTKEQLGPASRNVWRHDGFFVLETEAPPPRRRPAFREKKIEPHLETDAAGSNGKQATIPTVKNIADERSLRKGDGPFIQRGSYQSREKFSGGGIRGRDRCSGRYNERIVVANRTGGFQVEKWKHDLFDEANRSPTQKNEDEQIAEVEALLAQD